MGKENGLRVLEKRVKKIIDKIHSSKESKK
jgi:hypothetical protein